VRLLFWVIAIVCVAGLVEAQPPKSDASLPANKLSPAHRRLAPPHIQNRPPGPRHGPQNVQFAPSRLGSRDFHNRVYHGQRPWQQGRWHHTTRNGRFGWWWDVGGFWYFYSEPKEGPPTYVSDVEVADEATSVPPPQPEEPHHSFYYRPGDLKGVPYDTIEECTVARQQAGNVGVCVMK
jgi:hypothetical protein